MFLLLFVTAAAGDINFADHVAVGAVGLVELITDIDGMYEILRLGSCRDILLGLIQQGVTDLSIL